MVDLAPCPASNRVDAFNYVGKVYPHAPSHPPFRLSVLLALLTLGACAATEPVGEGNAFRTLHSYDGGGVIASPFNADVGGATITLFIAPDLKTTRKVLADGYNVTAVPDSRKVDGREYSLELTGASRQGAGLKMRTQGVSLNNEGSKFVTLNYVTVNERTGIASAGTLAKGVPDGEHIYKGLIYLVENERPIRGRFTLTTDFETGVTKMTAEIPSAESDARTYAISAEGAATDTDIGSISSRNVLVTAAGLPLENTALAGFFAGPGVGGVHGVIYSLGPRLTTAAVFYGTR